MKKAWNESAWYVKLIILIVIGIILFFIGRKIIVYIKKLQVEKILANSSATGSVGGTPYVVNYGADAQKIYNALYNNDWFGFTEDEETAVITINNVPKAFIPQLKETYFNLYSKNLNNDLLKYLSVEDYARVSNQLQN